MKQRGTDDVIRQFGVLESDIIKMSVTSVLPHPVTGRFEK